MNYHKKVKQSKTNKKPPAERPDLKNAALPFAGIMEQQVFNLTGQKPDYSQKVESLAQLDYEMELRAKNNAIREFWRQHHLPGAPKAVLSSPLPRNYRTTTRRRVFTHAGQFFLLFDDEKTAAGRAHFHSSVLEPEAHRQIYSFLAEKINQPAYHLVGGNLNFIIIRGNYQEFCVLFNVRALNSGIIRKLKNLAEHLQHLAVRVISAFVYLDPTRSDYYFESRRPSDGVSFKKLFGPDKLFNEFHGQKYQYYPTAFSQINAAMVPALLDTARELLQPRKSHRLVDLYCGYGLFTLYLRPQVGEAIGIEVGGASVKSAVENLAREKDRGKVRFLAKRISSPVIRNALPPAGKHQEIFILDPPRQGTDTGVIAEIANRRPEKVLHIFCGTDRIPPEIKEWHRVGYRLRQAIPLDLFPGTPNLETMVLLELQ